LLASIVNLTCYDYTVNYCIYNQCIENELQAQYSIKLGHQKNTPDKATGSGSAS
ncbi:MAG: hypothetical protein ACI9J0_003142, partial [Cryomorphaceae bacterium]